MNFQEKLLEASAELRARAGALAQAAFATAVLAQERAAASRRPQEVARGR